MRHPFNSSAIAVLAALALAACSRSETPVTADTATEAARPATAVPAPATPATPSDAGSPANDATPAKWAGDWKGVEGTYLKIKPENGSYGIEIADLDGPKSYKGTVQGDHIIFERNGKSESIRATDGDRTAMKMLAGKKDCLVITKGSEGFCRD